MLPSAEASRFGSSTSNLKRTSQEQPLDNPQHPFQKQFAVPTTKSTGCKQSSTQSCECTKEALDILEILEQNLRKFNASSLRLDVILRVNKIVVSRSLSLLQCPRCTAYSGFMNLLILIVGQKLKELFGWLTVGIERLHNHFPTAGIDAGAENQSFTDPQLGAYKLEHPEEWSYVWQALALLHISEFRTLLRKLGQIAKAQAWHSHECTLAGAHGAAEELERTLFGVLSRGNTISSRFSH